MRRVLAAAMAALLLLTAAGCAALFDKEVYTEEPYEVPSEAAEPEDAEAISNYAALRRAISRLVSEHAESGELQFQNYDGSISQDISTACWEVKSSTALGAFAVDYISYDLSRIVSYYQAEIYITYKRSEYQMSALEQMENLSAMNIRLEDALRNGETYLVLGVAAASLTADAVEDQIRTAYYTDPLTSPVLPAAETAVYPETGVSRIVELVMDYGLDGDTLAARRGELAEAVNEMALSCAGAASSPAEENEAAEERRAEETPADSEEPGAADPAELARALYAYLSENCVPEDGAGNTAWDALCGGSADSEGIAMALLAGCRALDIPCRIVAGRLEGEPHVWNIITIGGLSYHADASRRDAGEESVFLVSDQTLWGTYWWDTSQYPPCPETYGVSREASPELSSGESVPADAGEIPDTGILPAEDGET